MDPSGRLGHALSVETGWPARSCGGRAPVSRSRPGCGRRLNSRRYVGALACRRPGPSRTTCQGSRSPRWPSHCAGALVGDDCGTTPSSRASFRPGGSPDCPARVVVTGPVGETAFACRTPAEAIGSARAPIAGAGAVRAPTRAGAAPGRRPRGARAAGRAAWARDRLRRARDGSSVAACTSCCAAERGWRVVGRRGGIGGVGDRLRAHVQRTLAGWYGGSGARLLVGIVLGEDLRLDPELRGCLPGERADPLA